MKRIIWTDNFSLGVGVIDEQHKRLIDMINQLIDAENVAANSETVSDLLDAMTKYSKEHFRTEEGLLAKYGCPLLDEQKRDHRAYKIKTCRSAAGAGSARQWYTSRLWPIRTTSTTRESSSTE